MRSMTAAQIALMQNREGLLTVTFLLEFKAANWTATGALTMDDVFEYWFDKEKCVIEFKSSANIGVLASYLNTQTGRVQITETLTDGTTTVSESSPVYFPYTMLTLPGGRKRIEATALPFQSTNLSPIQTVEAIIDALFLSRLLISTFIAGQEWFTYDWSPAGSANIDLAIGDLPRILGKRYMAETFAREADVLFQNRYNSPNRIVDYTPFTTDIETVTHTSYNTPINGISWTDQTDLLHFSTGYKQPVHHLGFCPSTATQAIMDLISTVLQSRFKFTQWPDLRLENGDYARITVEGTTYAGLINCTHHYKKLGRGAPTWEQTVEAVQTPKALGTSRTPNRFMFPTFQISPISLELDTEFFRDILSRDNQSVQSALDALDRHVHASGGNTYTLQGQALHFNPVDSTGYFIGNQPVTPIGHTNATMRVYVPRAGVINRVYVIWSSETGVTGSAEVITARLRLNVASDTQIATVANAVTPKIFSTTTLGVTVAAGDYISVAIQTPAWATNPTVVKISWVAEVEV